MFLQGMAALIAKNGKARISANCICLQANFHDSEGVQFAETKKVSPNGCPSSRPARKMLPEYPLVMARREFIDVQSWLESAIASWTSKAAQARVRIDRISPSVLERIWTNPNGLNQIVHHFITEAIDSSISGDRIEVEIRLPDDTADWLTIIVRDWAGGRSANWNIEASIQGLAKQLEGYIDVSNHPGQSTVCSLHIPTGKLQGWLRRQPASMLIHHVSCSPASINLIEADAFDACVEAVIQMTLGGFGSFVPLGERAFLLSTSNAIDQKTIIDSIAHVVGNTTGFESNAKNLDVQCDCLGTMQEFLQRIERSLMATEDDTSKVAVRSANVAGSSENPSILRSEKGNNTNQAKSIRIDTAGLPPTPLSDRSPPSPRSAKLVRNRIQPRRVNLIQD